MPVSPVSSDSQLLHLSPLEVKKSAADTQRGQILTFAPGDVFTNSSKLSSVFEACKQVLL